MIELLLIGWAFGSGFGGGYSREAHEAMLKHHKFQMEELGRQRDNMFLYGTPFKPSNVKGVLP